MISVLVADPDQQEPSLATVDGDLPDELIEALLKQLLAYGADSDFACLPLRQSLIELLLELDDLGAGGGGGEDGLDPELPILHGELLGREDLAEDVLGAVGLFIPLLLLLLLVDDLFA